MMKKACTIMFVIVVMALGVEATQLDVIPAAALGGSSYGMRTTFDGGTDGVLVRDNSPSSETVYRVQYGYRNRITSMTLGDTHQIFRARGQGGYPTNETVLRVQIKSTPSGYIMFVWARLDNGGYSQPLMTFVPNVHQMMFEWAAATSPGANDGILRIYKSGNLIREKVNLDNDTYVVDFVQLGAFSTVDAATVGHQDFDNFESYRTLAP